MIGSTFFAFSAMSMISFALGLPTTYDQRQDGSLNVAGKLENILFVLAFPSSSRSKSYLESNSDLASYLTLLDHGANPSPAEYDVQTPDSATNSDSSSNESQKVDDSVNAERDEDDDIAPVSDEERGSEVVAEQPNKHSEEVKTEEKKTTKSSRTLWSQVEDVVDNREGSSSLKKELSWGQDADAVQPAGEINEQKRSDDHNDVGLIPSHRLILLGSAIEDCGPDRLRDSYGICQHQPAE